MKMDACVFLSSFVRFNQVDGVSQMKNGGFARSLLVTAAIVGRASSCRCWRQKLTNSTGEGFLRHIKPRVYKHLLRNIPVTRIKVRRVLKLYNG